MAQQWERPRRGVRDGGDRIAALTRWLKQTLRHDDVATLVLVQRTEDEWLPLGQWDREEAAAELATSISELCQDAADEAAAHVQLRLQWWTEDGKLFVQKQLRAWPAGASPSGLVESMDGTMLSQLQQTQRHLEAANQTLVTMARQQDDRWEKIFSHQNDFMERLVGRLELAEQHVEQAREERDQATELAAEAAEAAEAANERAEAAEQGDKLAKVVDVGLRQIAGGSGPKGA